MQFWMLEGFNLAYLYVLQVSTNHLQGSKSVYIETSLLKSNTKLKMNKIVKKGQDNWTWKKKEQKWKRKKIGKEKRLRQK